MAIAVSRAENGTRQCDRININNNKTLDIGIFQLNSIHFSKKYTLNDFSDCTKNIEIAYSIFKEQGWTPWVAYQNGSYKQFLTK